MKRLPEILTRQVKKPKIAKGINWKIRRQAPEERRGSTNMDMLQSVMEASSQAMFTLDREGTITHINH